jgi:hypothetical protein
MKIMGIAGLRLSAVLGPLSHESDPASLSTLRDLSKGLTLCHMLSSKLA